MKINTQKNISIALLLLIIVSASGCIGTGGKRTIEASSDVLKFEETTVIPNPPIFAGDVFSISFRIQNFDELKDAENAILKLYDWGMCKPKICTPNNWVSEKKESYSVKFDTIMAGDMQFIECDFRAPSQEEIAGIKTVCPIRFKLSYDFSGTTTTDLTVISDEKYRDLQKSGKVPSVMSTQTKSRGPIKVDFEFLADQPVRATEGRKIPLYIRIENKGQGKIEQDEKGRNKINMKVLIPEELLSQCSSNMCDGWFDGSSKNGKCELTLKNEKEIEFIKGKSEPIRCELTTDNIKKIIDEKTFYISSNIDYTYQINNQINIPIKPLKVV